MPEIKAISASELPKCLEVIHKGFATVAAEFHLSEYNCPKHTSFMLLESLQTHMSLGWTMFGLYDNSKLVGYCGITFSQIKSSYITGIFLDNASSCCNTLHVLTLPRSDIPIYTVMPLGASSKPANSSSACNTVGYFIIPNFYFTPACVCCADHSVSTMQKFRLVQSEVRQ